MGLDNVAVHWPRTGRFYDPVAPAEFVDFGEIVDMYTGHHILGVPTNATRGLQHAAAMVGNHFFCDRVERG